MKTEVQKPNIVRIAYHQEPGDIHYGSCLWAYFDLDLDRYMLSVQSDCGNAAYRWYETPKTESFLRLMSRVDADYLCGKLFKQTVVDVDATIRGIREWLGIGEDDYQDSDLSKEEWESLEAKVIELEGRFNVYTQLDYDLGLRIAEDWQEEYGLEIDCLYELIAMDYSGQEKRIIQIFEDGIQPMIAMLAEREAKTSGI